MKLKQFIGKNIRGYLNFNIEFNDSITFLIGINGTGKTTILKLLSGLLYPSYIELVQIEFSYIELFFEDKNSFDKCKISCKKNKDFIILTFNNLSKHKKIENEFYIVESVNIRNSIGHDSIETDNLSRILYEFDNLEVVEIIRSLRTPLFLGLNRRTGDSAVSSSSFEREIYYSRRNLSVDFLFDSVDTALRDIEEMFHNFVRTNAHSQYTLAERFRRKVFSESFKYEQLNHISPINYNEELDRLDKRKLQLNNAIDQLELQDIAQQFKVFLESMKNTLIILKETPTFDKDNNISQEYITALTQWMINSSQLEKIDNIIQYANEYSSSIQKSKEPLIRFLESANMFFKESKKIIDIDNKGEVKIKINASKKRNNIFELSSGEKQIIVLLAHIAFHKTNKNASVFIVDEPELSLHISWQELFVDALLKASPTTQFIFATHAPAIISTIERRKYCVDLTDMN